MPGFDAFDLAAYLRDSGAAAKPTGSPQEWLLRCPRCSGEEHLYVNVGKLCGHCFRCGWSPGLIDLLAALEGKPRQEIVARLGRSPERAAAASLDALRARVLGLGARRAPEAIASAPDISLPGAYIPLGVRHDDATERALAPFRAYLARRRVLPEHIVRHQFGCALVGRYQGRVILPVHIGGHLATYQARDITGRARAKYLGPAGAPVGDALFNLDDARTCPRIVVCEGIISAICAGPDAVASFGKALKPGQIALLVSARRPVVLLYDAAKAETGAAGAHAEAELAAAKLHRAGLPVKIGRLAHGDPADNEAEVVRAAITVALPFDPLLMLRRRLG